MYIPSHFNEANQAILQELISARPLATLVTLTSEGIVANHLPLHFSAVNEQLGILRGHVARANLLWKDTITSQEVLAIFQGPDTYISPSWYPTKVETHKVVPTWNYVVVHAYGKLRIIDDSLWLREHLDTLTRTHENQFEQPWLMTDAPDDFIEKLIGAVVGIEISIARLSGKWKVSQNQPAKNQEGVVRGLSQLGGASACEMAKIIECRRPK